MKTKKILVAIAIGLSGYVLGFFALVLRDVVSSKATGPGVIPATASSGFPIFFGLLCFSAFLIFSFARRSSAKH